LTTINPHLLLVDDEQSIRKPLAAVLGNAGFRVTTAADAAEARTQLLAGSFDLAILDIMMPGEDGLSLARFIRANGDLPIILLTARAEDIDRIVGLEMGADDYLAKPFNPRELTARIAAILRRSFHVHGVQIFVYRLQSLVRAAKLLDGEFMFRSTLAQRILGYLQLGVQTPYLVRSRIFLLFEKASSFSDCISPPSRNNTSACCVSPRSPDKGSTCMAIRRSAEIAT